MIILGIDPGIGRVGWAVLETNKGNQKALDFGLLETSKHDSLDARLKEVHQFVLHLISLWHPNVIAVEELFFATNLKTAFAVGQARGVILLAAALSSIPTASYTPLQIKQSITGYGKADKKQIQIMVKSILHLEKPLTQDDTADALAVALTHAFSYKLRKSLSS